MVDTGVRMLTQLQSLLVTILMHVSVVMKYNVLQAMVVTFVNHVLKLRIHGTPESLLMIALNVSHTLKILGGLLVLQYSL
jgi:hypothetical protein